MRAEEGQGHGSTHAQAKARRGTEQHTQQEGTGAHHTHMRSTHTRTHGQHPCRWRIV
ncbi:MAG: hypothetical protein PW786_01790 [Arachidicoccus sp.]|nr:hypothetical protein [Arachidicoccus sp.]